MIIDKLVEIADAASFVNEAGTYLIGSQIDLGANARDPGNGQPVYLVITVDTAATDGGDSATLTFKLASDDSASISTTTSTIHLQSGAMLKTALTAGAKFVFPLPTEGTVYERYLGLLYTVGTAGFDAGKINAFLTLDPHGLKSYPNATN